MCFFQKKSHLFVFFIQPHLSSSRKVVRELEAPACSHQIKWRGCQWVPAIASQAVSQGQGVQARTETR